MWGGSWSCLPPLRHQASGASKGHGRGGLQEGGRPQSNVPPTLEGRRQGGNPRERKAVHALPTMASQWQAYGNVPLNLVVTACWDLLLHSVPMRLSEARKSVSCQRRLHLSLAMTLSSLVPTVDTATAHSSDHIRKSCSGPASQRGCGSWRPTWAVIP